MSKKYDIAIKAGEYADKDGNQKAKWMNLGAVMQGDKGPYLLLDPHVNLAAFMEQGRDMIIASLFEPRQNNTQQQPQQQNNQQGAAQGGYGGAPSGNFDDFDDDIPF